MQSRQPALYFAALISDHDKSYEVMKMLIDAGANPFYKDHYQQTVIFYACR
jgi:ankyrin repeat protein